MGSSAGLAGGDTHAVNDQIVFVFVVSSFIILDMTTKSQGRIN